MPGGECQLRSGAGSVAEGHRAPWVWAGWNAAGSRPVSVTVRAGNGCGAVTKSLKLFVKGKPILAVTPGHISFKYRMGGLPPQEQFVLVEGSWPEVPYSLKVVDAPWLRAEQAAGRTPSSNAALTGDRVTLNIDPGKLAPGAYRGSLKFSTWGGVNAPEVEVMLTVLKSD